MTATGTAAGSPAGMVAPAGPETLAAEVAAGPESPAATPAVSVAGQVGRRTIDQVLAEARSRLRRVGPRQAAAEIRAGALLVDIRPQAQRATEGEVPGALPIERNVLEWRFDPASGSKLPQVRDHDIRVIIMCSQGYTSSLAAAALQDLGLVNATDLDGGFHAWAAAGLPVTTSAV
jgi:rhodanese-related sulfurtransferase